MLQFLIAFLSGCLLTIVIVAAGVVAWIFSQSKLKENDVEEKPYIQPQLPQELQDILAECVGDGGLLQVREETCHWLNFIIAFIFNELRDSTILKRLIMKKMNKEFEELMFTKTEGRMIEQLTVRDYFLGTCMPVIKSAALLRVEGYTPEDPMIQEMDIVLNVEYSGRFQMAIDADLVFDKAAYVSIELSKLSGRGRLQFSRKKDTHWSFSFIEDPSLEMTVNSQFEGRQYPQLSSIIESQVRKWLKKRHTLPAHKIRYKPFFRKFKPQNQLLDVYCHDQKVTVGKLSVSLLKCSRLPPVDGAFFVYCTLSIASLPWQPLVHVWKTQWPIHEFVVHNGAEEETIGILYKMVTHEESARSDFVIITKVVSPSAAYTAGVMKGDILTRVNNVKVTSVRQARRLMKKFKDGNRIMIIVQRPPAHFTEHLLHAVSCDSRGHTFPTPPRVSHLSNTTGASTTDGSTITADTTSHLESYLNISSPTAASTMSALVVDTNPSSYTPITSSTYSTMTAPNTAPLAQQSRHALRQRSHTAATSYLLNEPSLRVRSCTPNSSDDERVFVSERLGRQFCMDSGKSRTVDRGADTVSLYGVMGERGEVEEEDEEEEEEEDGGRYLNYDGMEYTGRHAPVRQGHQHGRHLISDEMDRESTRHRQVQHSASLIDGTASPLSLSVLPLTRATPSPTACTSSADDVVGMGEGGAYGAVGESVGGEEHTCVRNKTRDDHAELQQSREVQACRNPAWNQKFKFSVDEHHHYLNICVWVKLRDERGDLLIGHVTIPLMDIAMECFHTNSRTHMQRYVLVAAQTARATTSRTAMQATIAPSGKSVRRKKLSSKQFGEDPVFSGSMLLEFRHFPKLAEGENVDNDSQANATQLDEAECAPDRHSFVPSQDELPRNHDFVAVEHSGIKTKCDICGKLMWILSRVPKCRKCGLRCHRKCMEYCMTTVLCRRRRTGLAMEQVIEGLSLEEREGSVSDPASHRDLDQEHANQHRCRNDSFEVLEGPVVQINGSSLSGLHEEPVVIGSISDRTLDEGERGEKVLEEVFTELQDVDRDSSDYERLITPYPEDSDVDVEMDPRPHLKWSRHLPPEEREASINKRVADLQVEIDRIQELINNLYDIMQDTNITSISLRTITREIDRYQEKMEPLGLLMNEMMYELHQLT